MNCYFPCPPFAFDPRGFLLFFLREGRRRGKEIYWTETIFLLLVALQLHPEEFIPVFHPLRADCLGKCFR